ncbi:MurR/RpiR family transcriptional regulator [Georgenia subflava]|uniref:SIS domain-containing protein n=1 Tax=Georgenia subflava TaxID=1622177 RepID=A0A6N7ENW8_9MICO|nr:MurR/RpiR family transcriptional regulator [Georgenia subflava]MPV38808.1 SIS domain-containing protein [Georgenia subflava]
MASPRTTATTAHPGTDETATGDGSRRDGRPRQDGASLVSRVRALLPELRPAERRVGEAVVADPHLVARESVTALAERCRTSAPTVVRFAKRAGFSGFPELKLALATAAGIEEGRSSRTPLSGTLDPSDTLADIVAKIGYADARAVEDTVAGVDVDVLEQVVDALVGARRIDLVGIGASGVSATDLYQKLVRLGLPVGVFVERHSAMTALSLRGPGDVVVAISHSGATSDVLEPVRLAREVGARTVAVTNHPGSPLARATDLVLTTASHETTFRSGAMASRIAQLTLVDCVFVGVAARDFAATRRALDASFKAVGGL